MKIQKHRPAFSLIELLASIATIAILATIIISVVGNIRQQAMTSKSMSNIRALVTANYACAADTGRFAKAENKADTIRWHGKRLGANNWVGYDGYLTQYLGQDRSVRKCPVMEQILEENEGAQFDKGTGGYGYNAFYLGNDPGAIVSGGSSSSSSSSRPTQGGRPTQGSRPTNSQSATAETVANRPGVLIDPANTVMFTSTALVSGGGVVETYLSAPYYSLAGRQLGEGLTPTVHFRFNGKALVAWCDGHVTLEEPNDSDTSHNVYGDSNGKYTVGWFGPTDNNG